MSSRSGVRIPLTSEVIVEDLLWRRSAPLEFLRSADETDAAIATLALSLARDARRILNIGCAGGSLAVKLALSSGAAIVHAVDDSPALLRLAALLAGEWKVEFRVLLNRAGPDAVPLPDGTFDLVVGFQALCRSGDPGKVLGEAVRLAGPSGAVLFVEPERPGAWTSWLRLRARGGGQSEGCGTADAVRASGFAPAELRDLAARVAGGGWRVSRDVRRCLVLARPR